jgi:flagellar hook-associated protein 2
MAGISVTGIGSGLDINKIVTDLIAAEKATPTKRLDTRAAAFKEQLSGIGTFQSAVSEFRSALSNITGISKFQSLTASVGNTALFTASATSVAQAGSYNVEVTQLAQAQKLATDPNHRFASTTDIVGSGSLTFQFGTYDSGANTFTANAAKASKTVTIAANSTLEGVRDSINKADIGVQAGIINDGTGFRLTLSAKDSGAANSLRITTGENGTAGDSDGDNLDQAGLSLLAYDPTLAAAGKNMVQTQVAQNALLNVDGLDISSASNSVVGVVPGVTLNLKSKLVGAPTTLTVAQDTSATVKSVDAFVAAYNKLMDTSKSLTFYDAKTGEKGILLGDRNVRSITNQVRNILTSTITGATGTAQSIADAGVSLQKDGTLKLDSGKLQTALANDPKAIAALFTRTGVATDAQISFNSARAVAATQGQYLGATIGGTPNAFTIDSSNSNFAIKVNGISASTPINLTQQTYTGAALATELQTQINADNSLKNAGASVAVSYDSVNNRFAFTSAASGSASTVEFTQANAGLGLNVGVGTAGRDASTSPTAGTYAVSVSQLATQGQYTSGAITQMIIGSSNNSLAVKVNGVQSGAIALTQKTYATGADLATELQSQINADSALKAAGASISVSYDSGNNKFAFTSSAYGSASTVEVTQANTDLGLTATTGVAGLNVAGQLGGVTATGSGRTLTSSSGPAAGIAVDVLGGAALPAGSSRGTISLSNGVAQQLDDLIGGFLASKGPLTSRTDSINRQVTQLTDQRTALGKRMDALQARYLTQFTLMDGIVARLNSISTQLTNQLSNTSNSNK